MDLKEYIKSLVRQQLEEESTTTGVPGYMTPFTFSKGKGKNAATKQAEKEGWKQTKGETTMPSDSKLYDYKTLTGKKKKGVKIYKMNESLIDIVKEELLNEVTYSRFKNEVKFRTKNEQLHKAIREVKRKLAEIDRIVEYTSRMKQELSEGEEGLKYWKKTESNIATISEMVNQLNNKIKNLNQ